MSSKDHNLPAMRRYKIMGFGSNYWRQEHLSHASIQVEIELVNAAFYHPKEENPRLKIVYKMNQIMGLNLSKELNEQIMILNKEGDCKGWQILYGLILGDVNNFFMGRQNRIIEMPDLDYGNYSILQREFTKVMTQGENTVENTIEEGKVPKETIRKPDRSVDSNDEHDCYVAKAESLLRSGVSPNQANEYGQTLLGIASAAGHVPVVRLLLDAGADVKAIDLAGDTPLHNVLERFLEINQAVNDSEGEDKEIKFRRKSQEPTRKIVKLLIDAGVDVKARTRFERTALMMAVDCYDAEIVRSLIAVGADVNAADSDGRTALMRTAFHKRLRVFRAQNQNPCIRIAPDTLHYAVLQVKHFEKEKTRQRLGEVAVAMELEIPKLLLAANADVNSQDKTGFTALMFAARSKIFHVVELFLEAGANTELVCCNGKRAEEFAEGGIRDAIVNFKGSND